MPNAEVWMLSESLVPPIPSFTMHLIVREAVQASRKDR
jgi:hypothetical protein